MPKNYTVQDEKGKLFGRKSKTYICKECGYIGPAKKTYRGSVVMCLVLGMFFIVPGLLYWVWMFTGMHHVCPHCKSTAIIPSDSPVGQRLREELGK